ncbi:hypothetical protein [Paenibacillus naphthalenovorans]|uniref:hypothetical protein n=1 Tax=Paenibacillus naphthalenovorans TaxID=162209 RepID=UPI003D2CBB48
MWKKKGGVIINDTSVNLTTKLSNMGVKVYDSFNRANNASSMGNADTGQLWTYSDGSTWGISSNAAKRMSGAEQLGRAWIDSGISDVTVKCTFSTVARSMRVIFRATNDANEWMFGEVASAGKYALGKRVAGVFTSVASTATALAAGDRIRVTCKGSDIKCYVNGVLLASVNDTANQTATKCGLLCEALTTTYDEFSVEVSV